MKKMCYFEVDCHPKEALVVATKVFFCALATCRLWSKLYCIKSFMVYGLLHQRQPTFQGRKKVAKPSSKLESR